MITPCFALTYVAARPDFTTLSQTGQKTRGQLEDRVAQLEQQLAHVVVLDRDQQTKFACVGQANGVSLRNSSRANQTALGGIPLVTTLDEWRREAGILFSTIKAF